MCVNIKSDTDKLNFVTYRYRNNLDLKGCEIDLNLIENQKLFLKRVYLLRYYVSRDAFYWMEQLFIFEKISSRMDVVLFTGHFPLMLESKIVI